MCTLLIISYLFFSVVADDADTPSRVSRVCFKCTFTLCYLLISSSPHSSRDSVVKYFD